MIRRIARIAGMDPEIIVLAVLAFLAML